MLMEAMAAVSFLAAVLLPPLCGWLREPSDLWIPAVILLGGFLALILLFFVFVLVSSLLIGTKRTPRPGKSWYRAVVIQAAHILSRLARVYVRVEGQHKLPRQPYVMVSNHLSMFDPLVCLDMFREFPLAFISKPENFKIPAVGPFVRMCGFLTIDRENPRNAMRTIHTAVDLLDGGKTAIGVYPEGTRSKTGKLQAFHNGVMKIAQKSKTPLVIVAVQGTDRIARRFPLRSTLVYVSVLETVEPAVFEGWSSAELGDYVHRRLEIFLSEDV